MSPNPRSVSAPDWSRMVRESNWEITLKETRDGKFALITPVSTSTEGRWVAKIRWIPAARAIWVSWVIESSTSRRDTEVIIRSASSSMRMTM